MPEPFNPIADLSPLERDLYFSTDGANSDVIAIRERITAAYENHYENALPGDPLPEEAPEPETLLTSSQDAEPVEEDEFLILENLQQFETEDGSYVDLIREDKRAEVSQAIHTAAAAYGSTDDLQSFIQLAKANGYDTAANALARLKVLESTNWQQDKKARSELARLNRIIELAMLDFYQTQRRGTR